MAERHQASPGVRVSVRRKKRTHRSLPGMSDDHVDGECDCPLASKHCRVAMVRRDLWFRAVRTEDKEAMLRVAHSVGHGKLTRYSLDHTRSLTYANVHAPTHAQRTHPRSHATLAKTVPRAGTRRLLASPPPLLPPLSRPHVRSRTRFQRNFCGGYVYGRRSRF